MDITPEKFFFNFSQKKSVNFLLFPKAMLKERVGRLRISEKSP